MSDHMQTMPVSAGMSAAAEGRGVTSRRPAAARLARVGTLLVAGLLLLHGLAHSAGLGDLWGIGGAPANASTLLASLDPGAFVFKALGVAWLSALLLFVAAATALVARRDWWLPLAFAATMLSLELCVVWLEAAMVGLVLNVAILAGLTIWTVRRGTRGRTDNVGE